MVTIETWEERQVQFIAAVEKEKVLVTVLFMIISLVAVVLIGVIFHMIVMQKTRDIGIVKSLGGDLVGGRGDLPGIRRGRGRAGRNSRRGDR